MTVALRSLLQLDPSRVLARADQTIRDRDANLREITIAALAADTDLRSIRLLIHALGDYVPGLRREARRALLRHATDESLRPVVIQQSVQVLGTDSWRGLESALIVLTELQHRDINDQLLPLIDHGRIEVQVAAAIALGRIADPDSLPVLRRWYEIEGPDSEVGRSSGWAIMRMTGEPSPNVEPATRQVGDWFVEPLSAD